MNPQVFLLLGTANITRFRRHKLFLNHFNVLTLQFFQRVAAQNWQCMPENLASSEIPLPVSRNVTVPEMPLPSAPATCAVATANSGATGAAGAGCSTGAGAGAGAGGSASLLQPNVRNASAVALESASRPRRLVMGIPFTEPGDRSLPQGAARLLSRDENATLRRATRSALEPAMMSLASALVLLALASPAPAASSAQRIATTAPSGTALPPATRAWPTSGSSRPWRPGWNCPPSPACPASCGGPATVVQVIIVNAPVYGDVVMVNAPVNARRSAAGSTWTRTTSTSRTLASK